MSGTYRTALLCRNGHLITDNVEYSPEEVVKFCPDCGAPTLSECEACGTAIRGLHKEPGVLVFGYARPDYCHECGSPYAWLAEALASLNELAALTGKLSKEELIALGKAVDDLVKDTPRTQAAAARLKILAPKLGAEAWGAMKEILVKVATEAAKQQLGL